MLSSKWHLASCSQTVNIHISVVFWQAARKGNCGNKGEQSVSQRLWEISKEWFGDHSIFCRDHSQDPDAVRPPRDQGYIMSNWKYCNCRNWNLQMRCSYITSWVHALSLIPHVEKKVCPDKPYHTYTMMKADAAHAANDRAAFGESLKHFRSDCEHWLTYSVKVLARIVIFSL